MLKSALLWVQDPPAVGKFDTGWLQPCATFTLAVQVQRIQDAVPLLTELHLCCNCLPVPEQSILGFQALQVCSLGQTHHLACTAVEYKPEERWHRPWHQQRGQHEDCSLCRHTALCLCLDDFRLVRSPHHEQVLDLTDNKLDSWEGIARLGDLPSLSHLHLTKNGIPEAHSPAGGQDALSLTVPALHISDASGLQPACELQSQISSAGVRMPDSNMLLWDRQHVCMVGRL